MNGDHVISEMQSMTGKKIRRYSESNVRRVRRPEEIIRDVRGLKLRQRVSLVLGDEVLRDELEQTIKKATGNSCLGLENIRTYEDFLLPTFQPSLVNIGNGGNGTATFPINDIKGNRTLDYSKVERYERCKLAALYRLVYLRGWCDSIANHISVRPNPDKLEFLLQPFGLLFNEITASSLLKCDLDGKIIDQGSTSLGINKAGFVLHSCIHGYRPEVHCVIHVHTPDAVAVSSMKCGFLRLSQESLMVGDVSYHDYCGVLVNEAECESIQEDLGPDNMVLFLRNHGVVVLGKTVEEAFNRLVNLMTACSMQVKVIPAGIENLNLISDEAYEQVKNFMKNTKNGVMMDKGGKGLKFHDYHFEAHMRMLDAQGYRTGYMYRIPDVFTSEAPSKKIPESRLPPQVTSDRSNPYQLYYDQQLVAPGMFGAPSMGRGNTHRNRMKWLSNPVQGTRYAKEEKEYAKPELEPPVLEDPTHVPNGHVEENITETIRNDTKVVTKTTTVTETQVITELSPGANANKETVVVSSINGGENVVHQKPRDPSPEVSSPLSPVNHNGLENNHSLNGSVSEADTPSSGLNGSGSDGIDESEKPSGINGESIKSPNKVKKQKSFKKALMKKFKKEDK